YRSEIDGLRAIAVIPVIFFHAGFEYFSGGFVGVDVFFVISGYLITTIILSEKEQGTFSLINFYERRARRILPALFLVMLVSLPFAWALLLPADMKDFSQSLVAVSSFASNILFWQETGYWETASELKPLLHTWSLAVEEQYYVLFPLFLMLMWRFRKRWILSSFMVVAIISLSVAQWGAYSSPSATFYLLPTRGWELAIGAAIAFYFLYRKREMRTLLSHQSIDEALAFIGLLMIGYSVFEFDETVPFPSLYALIPTIGAGLIIIFASSQTLVGRLLSTKPFVAIGLISYSAYLWHQPLLTFARHRSLTEPSELSLAVMAALSLPLAYLSWRFVEKPFRQKNRFSRKAVFTFSTVGTALFIIIGLTGHMTNGFDGRSNQGKLTTGAIQKKLEVNDGLSDTCVDSFTLSPDCRTSDNPEVLIWGDSFAMHLTQGIIASNPDAKIIQMTKSMCGPFFDIAQINSICTKKWANGCLEFNGKVRDWLKTNNTVQYVVLSSPFTQYIGAHNKLLFRNGKIERVKIDQVIVEFKKTLDELKSMGLNPIIFSPPPANGYNLGRCLALADWRDLNLDECNYQEEAIAENRIKVYEFLTVIEKEYRVIRLEEFLCDNEICKTHLDSNYIYRDVGHLSREGSAALGEKYDFYNIITRGL
ncbi:acyltransferase, partial [Mariprofundus sp. EBB-1]|uniref:acyltransferase family protein n=1 Tax=Mariprofundus sp. EBB-1 TaxID=2650971 RepID=UPI000F28AAFC